MALLGEFEAAVKAADPEREPDQFKLNGELFTVSEDDQTMAWGMFARASVSGMDTADMESLAALIDILEGVVIDEDKPRLLQLAKRVHLDPETLLKIVQTVLEAESGRPTQQPSDSSGGPSTTGESLKEPSVSDPRREGLEPVARAALTMVG